MIAIENILVPVDFSDCSSPAIDRALALAETFGARLHLLHVVTEPMHEAWAGYTPGRDFLDIVHELESDAKRRLEELASSKSFTTQPIIATAWGDASHEILKYAAADVVDVIVCGTHGRSGLDRAMMGSVAERLVRLASCPVLTVRATADGLTSRSSVSGTEASGTEAAVI